MKVVLFGALACLVAMVACVLGSTSSPVVEMTTQGNDCLYEKDAGPCKALFWRYYYDTQVNRCMKFAYGGCYGNGNNFVTLEDCENACMGGVSNNQPVSRDEADVPTLIF
ncbi:hypothetical protein ACF0H5_002550 [Mactra antiquata]